MMDGSDYNDLAAGRTPGRDPPHLRAALARQPASSRPQPLDAPNLPQLLLDRGAVTVADLQAAQATQAGTDLTLGCVLLLQDVVTEAELLSAQAESHGISLSHLTGHRPDPELKDLLPVETAIALGAVPWRKVGSAVVIALTRPDLCAELRATLPECERLILTLAPRAQILEAQVQLYGEQLARMAEGQAPLTHSCRSWNPAQAARLALLAMIGMLTLATTQPTAFWGGIIGLTFAVFGANMILKAITFAATLRADQHPRESGPVAAFLHPPTISILVPLYKEREIASTLIANLKALDYPRERLDVILAVEADDTLTQAAIHDCTLPPWIRTVLVPPGAPRTKPRALNFALNFARGSLIGIYDAEDRPETDQLRKVVARYAEVPADVACLQGRLDYYNATHNWLARSFTIEYANWFRVLLPGVQRLGLFVPLGGTTLFIRREVLQKIGGWDAHNVTEDAELGLRIARLGYRTEIVDTTTYEEANAAVLPWIGQRSRWQKGYLMTWAMAMRRPARLWSDLGGRRFVAFQVQVLCAVLGFLVAPVLWSFIVIPFGVHHPVLDLLTPTQVGALAVFIMTGTALSIAIAIRGTRAPHLRKLRPWILVTELYYLCATFSAWRALLEMMVRPFWWSKTRHGHFGGTNPKLPK